MYRFINIFFSVVLFFPGILVVVQKNKMVATFENRNLERMPDFFGGLSREKIAQFESFFNDRIFFREFFIKHFRSFKRSVLRKSVSQLVLPGLDGWLFFTGENILSKIQGLDPLGIEELKKLLDEYNDKQNFLSGIDVPFYLVIPPNKSTVYSEYLPPYIKVSQAPSRVDQIVDFFVKHADFSVLDLKPALLKAKKSGLAFLKKDSHWSLFGASQANEEILRHLRNRFPQIPMVTLEPESFEYHSQDLLAILDGVPTKDQDLLGPLPTNTCSKLLSGKPTGRETIHTICLKNKIRGIVFRDSFFIALQPFFSEGFFEVLYIWDKFSVKKHREIIEKFKPDFVIEEIVERSW